MPKEHLRKTFVRREQAEKALLDRFVEMTHLNIKPLGRQPADPVGRKTSYCKTRKLASIGQLAAGVAHEINNPIGYVFSNFSTLEHYVADLLSLIETYHAAEPHIADELELNTVKALRERLDLDFLKEDTRSLMSESREGIERVRKIVQDLKDFSHVDSDSSWQWADLHKGIDSTLNIASNEIKYHADVIKNYGQIPQDAVPAIAAEPGLHEPVGQRCTCDGRPGPYAVAPSRLVPATMTMTYGFPSATPAAA